MVLTHSHLHSGGTVFHSSRASNWQGFAILWWLGTGVLDMATMFMSAMGINSVLQSLRASPTPHRKRGRTVQACSWMTELRPQHLESERINMKCHWVFKLSKHISSDIFPSARSHLLSLLIQHHEARNKCSNTWAYGGNFIQATTANDCLSQDISTTLIFRVKRKIYPHQIPNKVQNFGLSHCKCICLTVHLTYPSMGVACT